MPRKARVLIDGGYYHVLTRGIDKRKLFRYRQDYAVFMKTLLKYLGKFNVQITNYCLMPNHIHLLIYAQGSGEMPKFMQAVLQVYAGYFRNKYKSAGFVFQNRYKSFLIDNASYLLECARYIERNPIRSGITRDLLEYEWNSFSFYAGGKESGIIKSVNPLYLELAQDEVIRRKQYSEYVLKERPYEHIIDKEFNIR